MDKKNGKKVDKSGQKKKISGFPSGKRLKLARDIRMLRDIDIVNAFENLTQGALEGWYKRVIPKKRVIAVADFFGVDEWLFSKDTSISREEFIKRFSSKSPEAPPTSTKSRLALFPVHFFHQDISKSFSAGTTNKEDVSAGEKMRHFKMCFYQMK